MGDLVTFTPNTGSNPLFVGRGSYIRNPDILPIFWGSYWPGSGEMTVDTIMQALKTMTSGAYLQGLTQYGYGGSASVRPPRVDRGFNGFGISPSQTAVDAGVDGYIKSLLNDDAIDNVDDNHELIVVVFLDPSVPIVPNPNGSGFVLGDNGPIEKFEFLDDNTRFQRAWIGTSSGQIATVTQILSHELAESISDPFNSGWYQQTPPAPGTSDQINDVCNQNGLSDGVAVTAYWSNADSACIIPTSGNRFVSLSHTVETIQQPDGPVQQAFIDLGILCGGGRLFEFVERTYVNNVTINAKIDGYESPNAQWTIDGQPIPVVGGVITVAATFDEPPGASVRSEFAQLRTFNPGVSGSQIKISVGPNAGNVAFRVTLSVREEFDSGPSARGSTRRTAILDLDLKNQELQWSKEFKDATSNCDVVMHLSDGPGVVIGKPRPGDPAHLADRFAEVMRELGVAESNLVKLAELVETSRPELAAALRSLGQRSL